MPRKKKSAEESVGIESGAAGQVPAAAKPAAARKRTPAAPRKNKAGAAVPAKPRPRRVKAAADRLSLPDSLAAQSSVPGPNGSEAAAANSVAHDHDGSAFPEAVSLREQIALLAYSYWEARGRQGGSPQEDWIRAEREILSQRTWKSGI